MARQNLENEELGGVIRAKINDNFSELYQAVDDINFESSVKPTLSSDFGSNEHKLYEQYGLEPKTITQMYDVVRASTATYVDATGKIRTAGVNEPRVDYSSGQGRLLVEEARTNLLTWSEDFSNSAWVKTNGLIVDPTSIQGTVDGTTFFEIIDDSDTLDKNLRRVQTIPTNSLGVTQWAIFKKGASDRIGVRSALTGGTAIFGSMDYEFSTDTIYNNSPLTGFRVKLSTDVVLFGCTVFNNGTNTTADVRFYPRSSFSSTNTGSVYINAAQLEQAPTPSSYIPTEASAVTRAADNVSRELGDEFNKGEFTVYIHHRQNLATTPIGTRRGVMSINTTAIEEGSWVLTKDQNTSELKCRFRSGGWSDNTLTPPVLDNPFKFCASFGATSVSYFLNGVFQSSRTYPSGFSKDNLIEVFVGREKLFVGNGLTEDFRIYPKVLSESECINLTKV